MRHIRRYLGHLSIPMTERHRVAIPEIEDILQHVGSPGGTLLAPDALLSDGVTRMHRQQAEALVIDLSSTPVIRRFCTYQQVDGNACPWKNPNCHTCNSGGFRNPV